MTILATDDFNRADGGLGANWTTTTSEDAPLISTNEARNSTGVLTGGGARYTGALTGGGAWPNDQYAEVIIGSVVSTTTDEGVGGACRIASGAKTHYLVQGNTHETRIYKVVAGAFTQLGSDGPAVATGDKLRLICSGTSISATKNGTTIIGPVTDSDIASGDAGIWCTPNGGPGTANSFEGGDLATSAAGKINDFSSFPKLPFRRVARA
jgi:hypothetical protein